MVDILKVREQAKKKKAAKKNKAPKKSGKKAKSPSREVEVVASRAEEHVVEKEPSPGTEEQPGTKEKPSEREAAGTSTDGDTSVVSDSGVSPAGDLAASAARETAARARLARFLEAAGEITRQTEGLREEEAESISGKELLTFAIAGESYAVEVAKLVEIVVPRPATEVPNSPPAISGLISLRGAIVTLVDLRHLLRLPPESAETLDTRIIILKDGDDMIGFRVDAVSRVAVVEDADLSDHPEVIDGELSSLFAGVFTQDDQLVALLDIAGVAAESIDENVGSEN